MRVPTVTKGTPVSTLPGPDSWEDAGLLPPPPARPVEIPADEEGDVPAVPRPGHSDSSDLAPGADVAEQAAAVGEDPGEGGR